MQHALFKKHSYYQKKKTFCPTVVFLIEVKYHDLCAKIFIFVMTLDPLHWTIILHFALLLIQAHIDTIPGVKSGLVCTVLYRLTIHMNGHMGLVASSPHTEGLHMSMVLIHPSHDNSKLKKPFGWKPKPFPRPPQTHISILLLQCSDPYAVVVQTH